MSSTTNAGVQFTAPASAGGATITCKVLGQSSSISFNVVAPNGQISAEIDGTNHYPVGWVGAGMTNTVIVYPTNVSFYRVELVELACIATNITGYFTNSTFDPITIGYAPLDYDNSCDDDVEVSFEPSSPLYPGGWVVNTPVVWEIVGTSATNTFGTFHNPAQLLDSSGDFSDTKYGITITRSTNDVSYSTQ